MPIIEGVGDEVIHFFFVIILIFVGIVAWRSTGLTDRQIIRTVLILERRSRHQILAEQPAPPAVASSALENDIDTGQAEVSSSEEIQEETEDRSNDSQKENETATDESGTSQDSCNTPCVGEDVLDHTTNLDTLNTLDESIPSEQLDNQTEQIPAIVRQRRLAFFHGRVDGVLEASGGDQICSSSTTEPSPATEQEPSTSGTHPSNTGNIRIRLKYLNDDQKLVQGRLQELLGDFKRRHFALELAADKLVRLIFNGRVLQRDSETLQSLGLFDNCVVHCLVHQQNPRPNSNNATRRGRRNSSGSAGVSGGSAANETGQRDWDLGNLLFASLSILLGLAWYCRYQYAALFNTTATIALAGMTGVLVFSLVGLYLPDPDLVRQV